MDSGELPTELPDHLERPERRGALRSAAERRHHHAYNVAHKYRARNSWAHLHEDEAPVEVIKAKCPPTGDDDIDRFDCILEG